MALFPIQTKTVTFRGKAFTVREMTAEEKAQWAEACKDRPTDALFEAARRQTNWESPMDIGELRKEPAALVEKLATAIFDLSEIELVRPEGSKEKKEKG